MVDSDGGTIESIDGEVLSDTDLSGATMKIPGSFAAAMKTHSHLWRKLIRGYAVRINNLSRQISLVLIMAIMAASSETYGKRWCQWLQL
jgi:hypothetical protein